MRSIFVETAKDLLKLEIVSRLIIEIPSGRDDAAAIIEKLRLRRYDSSVRKKLDMFDALQFGNFLHTIELAEMLINNRRDDIDEFRFVSDEFWIDENIVHRDVVR